MYADLTAVHIPGLLILRALVWLKINLLYMSRKSSSISSGSTHTSNSTGGNSSSTSNSASTTTSDSNSTGDSISIIFQ